MYTESDYRDMFIECGFTDLPKGDSGIVRCPQHEDRHPSMSITVSKGLFNCFSCHYSGQIAKLYRTTFHKAYKSNSTLSPDEILEAINRNKTVKVVKSIPEGFNFVKNEYQNPSFQNWLKYRGISKDVAKAAGAFFGGVTISYTDERGVNKSYKVMDRVMFPILDENDKVVNLEMRYPFTGQESKKFKESIRKVLYPKKSSTNLLYEYKHLDKHKKLYILEGLMDCLAFRSLTGLENTSTIFGAMITKHQLELLNEFDSICYVYNNDAAGIQSVKELRDNYKGNMSVLKPADNFDDVGEMAIAGFKEVDNWLKTEKKF